MTEYILSWGGGVNSTAILAMIKLGMLPELTAQNTHIVFADTGAEMPYTYEHTTKCLFPMARDGWTVVRLAPHDERWNGFYSNIIKQNKLNTLFDYYCHYKFIPSRMNRSCTQHYKIDPIRKYKISVGAKIMVLGIDAGERHRAKELGKPTAMYPLIDHGLVREDCIELIKKAGLPEAHKSGCYFCPFQRKDGWVELYTKYPDLFQKVEELEEQRKRKDLYIKDEPIRNVLEKWAKKEKAKCDQQDLFDTNRHCLCEV